MCSCHLNLRAFGAIADVANHGKSVKLPFLATFGKLVLPILANFIDCQNWKEKSGNDACLEKGATRTHYFSCILYEQLM